MDPPVAAESATASASSTTSPDAATGLLEIRSELLQTEAAAGHPELVAHLGADDAGELAGSADVTVVVVGEKKRGKSSLVNALLRRPDLFPVDVDIATSCYIGARYSAETTATAYGDQAPDGQRIDIDAIGEWASVEGNRVPGSNPAELLHAGVTAVIVGLPNPLLEAGLTLVDTPGVGGLEAGHTDITLATLRQADAMLFVVDPDSGLRSSELDFLSKATGRVSEVAFVLTKVDRYPGWRDVLDENRARLAASAPEWSASPWFDVSSLIAYDAAEAQAAGDDDAADLWRESGFDRLEEHLLQQVAGRTDELRAANLAHSLRRALRGLEEAERLAVATATGDPVVRDQLVEQQAALATALADDARWPADLAKGFDGIRTSLQKDFRTGLRQARADLQDRLAEDSIPLGSLPGEVDAALRAVWMEVSAELQTQAQTLVAMLAGELAASGADALSRQFDYPDRLASLPPLRTIAETEKDFGDTVDDYMPVMLATGGAYSILVGMLSLVNPVTAIAIGLGAGLARRNAQQEKRTRARDRASGIAYMTRVLEQAADDMGTDLQQSLNDLRESVEQVVRDLMTARRDELEGQIRELKQRVRSDEAAEEIARRRADRSLRALAELRTRLDDIAAPAAHM
jgi:hypothetical protein